MIIIIYFLNGQEEEGEVGYLDSSQSRTKDSQIILKTKKSLTLRRNKI